MVTTIVVILIVWVVLSVPISLLAARMLRDEPSGHRDSAPTSKDESHPGRSFR
ncbi:hypothetical protein [Nocardia rhizosphaerihabitans]|uniref:Uncharacterized protein n=1 Tax=Nocardia rhizosphaerihabitans TaxID=1691570 RepID=A0ABQ2KCE8_9NOCA|nr:hypothetical protein [Nocardia rhizosphaerihabitans]GGN78029.1 hypothetical protein GCM10011610_25150 [Nocardia rhizosphaerihabitans]